MAYKIPVVHFNYTAGVLQFLRTPCIKTTVKWKIAQMSNSAFSILDLIRSSE